MFELVILCVSASLRESVLVAAEGCAKSSVAEKRHGRFAVLNFLNDGKDR